MTSITGSQAIPGASLYRLYVGALATCLVGNLLIRVGAQGGWLPQWGELVIAIAAAAPLGVAALLFWRLLHSELDEMLRRIVLEGLAFALVVYVPLAALYVNLRTASGVWTPRLIRPTSFSRPRFSRLSASPSRGGGCSEEQPSSAASRARMVAGRSRGPARGVAPDNQRARAWQVRPKPSAGLQNRAAVRADD